jgi:SET domain-containing protein
VGRIKSRLKSRSFELKNHHQVVNILRAMYTSLIDESENIGRLKERDCTSIEMFIGKCGCLSPVSV